MRPQMQRLAARFLFMALALTALLLAMAETQSAALAQAPASFDLAQIDEFGTQATRPLLAILNGANEVPGPGDPDGTGFALVQARQDNSRLCFVIAVDNVTGVTAAHIHEGASDVSGGVVVNFGAVNDTVTVGCVGGLDPALVAAIYADPAGYYVNVHNGEFPAGAVRGQLQLGAQAARASLDGAQEVPGPGDPDGSGRGLVTYTPDNTTLCYALEVSDVATPTAAHIHEGEAGVSGGVVVGLVTPADGFVADCTSDPDSATIEAIRFNPEGYYFNVHNGEFPAGAVRGQLADVG